MASPQSTTRVGLTESIERLVRAHEKESAQLREQFGDPQVALFTLTRDRLDRESLMAGAPQSDDQRAGDEGEDDDLVGQLAWPSPIGSGRS